MNTIKKIKTVYCLFILSAACLVYINFQGSDLIYQMNTNLQDFPFSQDAANLELPDLSFFKGIFKKILSLL